MHSSPTAQCAQQHIHQCAGGAHHHDQCHHFQPPPPGSPITTIPIQRHFGFAIGQSVHEPKCRMKLKATKATNTVTLDKATPNTKAPITAHFPLARYRTERRRSYTTPEDFGNVSWVSTNLIQITTCTVKPDGIKHSGCGGLLNETGTAMPKELQLSHKNDYIKIVHSDYC